MCQVPSNMVADALSHLEINKDKLPESSFTVELSSQLYCLADDDIDNDIYPLSYQQIGAAQAKDKALCSKLKEKDSKYYLKTF